MAWSFNADTRKREWKVNPCKRKCHDCGNIAQHEDNIVPYVNCKKCGSQDTRLVRDKTVEPEQSYDQVLLRKNLPPLPAGWHGPWEADQDGNLWGMRHGRLCDFAIDCGFKNAQFLAALLNVTHPSQTKWGE